MVTTRAAGRMGDPTEMNQGRRGQRFEIKGSDILAMLRERIVVVKEKMEPILGVFRRLVARPGILIMAVGSMFFLAAIFFLVTLSLFMTKCNSGVHLPAASFPPPSFAPLPALPPSCVCSPRPQALEPLIPNPANTARAHHD